MYVKYGLVIVVLFLLTTASIGVVGFSGWHNVIDRQTCVGDEPYPGYTLFGPWTSNVTYLIDNNGTIVHTWPSKHIIALGSHLLENGCLLRSCSPQFSTNTPLID